MPNLFKGYHNAIILSTGDLKFPYCIAPPPLSSLISRGRHRRAWYGL
ncbi:hypothetical protein HMPREF3033_00299 [Veillonellaceae bacterium DNF00751]|nr:hypothetical protein HMPREF3033_00299 [Veillonellaceae bacterium DNF00751]